MKKLQFLKDYGTDYLVDSLKDARHLAEIIAKDDGRCLVSQSGHSLACGDGQDCAEERLKRARALAQYFQRVHL